MMMVKRRGFKSKSGKKMGRPPLKKGKHLRGSFIGLRIDEDLKARLEEFGDQEGKSISDVMKDLIKKHVETKQAVEIDLADEDVGDEEEDEAYDSEPLAGKNGKPHQASAKKKRKKEPPVEQVRFETLLDDLLHYQSRLKELNDLMADEKKEASGFAGLFRSVPPHLKIAKTVCEKKLKLISEQMTALFPAEEKEEEKEEFQSVL